MSYISDISRADRMAASEDFPRVILLDNTSACNLRCSMCDHHNIKQYRKIQTMPYELYCKIIDEVAVESPESRIWEIFFGDPFLCRDMPKRIAYAKKKGLKDVVVNTNGQLMTRDRAKEYIESGLDAIYVGIDAATPETYAKIRVGGSYEQAVANVLAYRDLVENVGGAGQKLFVQYVVSEHNENEVEAFKQFWTGEGVNIKIRPKISWAGLVRADNLSDNGLVDRRPCYWLMQTINICADGRVAFCSVDLHCREACGDVNTASIKDIWQNGLPKRYRDMHLSGAYEKLPTLCRDCKDWQSAYADFVQVK